ncbi:MAG: Peptidase A24A prepilin type IV [archaeon GW2011_AR20]|nr:MAG: Peptidase A24A prepilin type IV [archaeon GW2011_AR20]AQS28438.1 hypothetical protein [uncultured archaeon]MBS3160276.1 prepilin peptidase [Candidatus Woesearchaeota archaeon]
MIDLIVVIISLLWLIYASYQDFKTREVPDWISYSLIIIASAFYLIKSFALKDSGFILQSSFGLLIFYLTGSLMYYTRQWGGGDVKLLSALGALFPVYPKELLNYFNPNLNLPFLLILILNLVIFGALYSLIFSFYLVLKNRKKIKFSFKINKIYSIIAILFVIIQFFSYDLISKLLFLFLALIILIYPYLKNYIRVIEDKIMKKRIPASELTEGDWILENIYYKEKLIYNKNNPGVSNNEIKLFHKYRIKNVLIKEGLPFIPSFLLSLIFSFIFGSLFT